MYKNYLITLIIAILSVITNVAFAGGSFDDDGFANKRLKYWEECEKCVKAQEKILSAVVEYCKAENKNSKTLTQEETNNVEKILLEKKYLKESVTNSDSECNYRLAINDKGYDVFCTKHGGVEFNNNCVTLKNKYENNVKVNGIIDIALSILGVIFIIYALFFEKT